MDSHPATWPASPTIAGIQDYSALDHAATEFDMTEREIYELIRAGTVLGVHIPAAEGVSAGWYVDRASLAEYRRGDTATQSPDGRDLP